MGQEARQGVEARDFPGLMTALDPTDLPPGGAVVQENVISDEGGLRTRPGVSKVTFEEE